MSSPAHRPDEEDEVGVDELTDERGRRRVEQVEVIDEEHERPVRGLVGQDLADLGHRPLTSRTAGRRDRRAAGGPARRAGPPGSPAGRRPGHVAARPSAHREALVGRARSCRRRPARDDEQPWARGPRGSREQLDLLVATDEGPLQRTPWAAHALGPDAPIAVDRTGLDSTPPIAKSASGRQLLGNGPVAHPARDQREHRTDSPRPGPTDRADPTLDSWASALVVLVALLATASPGGLLHVHRHRHCSTFDRGPCSSELRTSDDPRRGARCSWIFLGRDAHDPAVWH